MKAAIIYYSKTGNTKSFAEHMAKKFKIEALPLNLMAKKGRGTKEEVEKEKILFNQALEASKDSDFVIICTPTSFKKAHSKILRFAKKVEAKNVSLFCSHYNQLGNTFSDLETILKNREISIIGKLEIDNLKPNQFRELNKSTQSYYLKQADEFIKRCLNVL